MQLGVGTFSCNVSCIWPYWETLTQQQQQLELTTKYERFVAVFQRVFDHAPEGKEVGEHILALEQSQCSVAEYALDFRTTLHSRPCFVRG